jgi:hypothetical protein
MNFCHKLIFVWNAVVISNECLHINIRETYIYLSYKFDWEVYLLCCCGVKPNQNIQNKVSQKLRQSCLLAVLTV